MNGGVGACHPEWILGEGQCIPMQRCRKVPGDYDCRGPKKRFLHPRKNVQLDVVQTVAGHRRCRLPMRDNHLRTFYDLGTGAGRVSIAYSNCIVALVVVFQILKYHSQ
eukprot:Lithocolla_globosa_v1_NODE_85_length_6671_cov_4.306832.p6 type:complete len:108 gc:universal NODE_85_length_6671_cov_4.306832:2723-2400(-)